MNFHEQNLSRLKQNPLRHPGPRLLPRGDDGYEAHSKRQEAQAPLATARRGCCEHKGLPQQPVPSPLALPVTSVSASQYPAHPRQQTWGTSPLPPSPSPPHSLPHHFPTSHAFQSSPGRRWSSAFPLPGTHLERALIPGDASQATPAC